MDYAGSEVEPIKEAKALREAVDRLRYERAKKGFTRPYVNFGMLHLLSEESFQK